LSASNIYGQIIDGDTVEQAVVASLNIWISDYLGEMERLKGYAANTIERPHGIVTSSEFEKWPEDQVPVILVMAAATGKPKKHEQGKYEATWTVGIAPVVSDINQPETRKLAMTYAAAIRAAIVQHKLLKSSLHAQGFASSTEWQGEDYSDIAFSDTRTLGSARVMFAVAVDDVVTAIAGPREPSITPSIDPGNWPGVQRIDLDLDPQKLDSEVLVG